jgi:hypothetical protein
MSTSNYTYEKLSRLHEDSDYHQLSLWVHELADESKYKWGDILRYFKKMSGEVVAEDPEDNSKEALSLIWQWFAVHDEDGIKKYKKFWKHVFDVKNDLRQLRNRLIGSKRGKFKEILQAQYQRGGMHKNEGLHLHRMCRDAMDDETFRKEKLKKSDYYGLSSWPELLVKGFLREGETIKELPQPLQNRSSQAQKVSYYVKRSNVVDGGERTSPWPKEGVRKACLLALGHVEKYSLVKQLKEAMVSKGWFELINATAKDYIAVFGQNKDGDGDEHQTAEPYDENEKNAGALNSGKPSDQFLKASEDETFEEFKLFWAGLDREIRIVFRKVFLADEKNKATTHELAVKYGKTHGTWHNRKKTAKCELRKFREMYEKEDYSLICRLFSKFIKNEDLGTLLPIDETNDSEKQSS